MTGRNCSVHRWRFLFADFKKTISLCAYAIPVHLRTEYIVLVPTEGNLSISFRSLSQYLTHRGFLEVVLIYHCDTGYWCFGAVFLDRLDVRVLLSLAGFPSMNLCCLDRPA
ncbi:hypothetical protein BPOR_0662g00030 [Botrytis porri]|uniref:Uncharacterized protein n=1 Tax=Botrytis porri TaxID=87229 RepID=A0A4Z1KB02_9HELO|nr:hypothetical protein BPOR_0662g00030 [Botrytis porri]